MTALTPNGNKYALAALRERRAELSGEIAQLESRLRSLRESIEHVDGTLRLFVPGFDPASIKGKRPYHRTKLFGAGKLNRLILGALRKTGTPTTTAEVVDGVCAELEWGPDAVAGMAIRVRTNLHYLVKRRGTGGQGRGWRGSAVGVENAHCSGGFGMKMPRRRSQEATSQLETA